MEGEIHFTGESSMTEKQTQTTKSYSIANNVFFLMQKHGSHDVKYEYELEKALKEAYNAAIDAAYKRLFPTNPENDWTQYAKDMANAAEYLLELKR